MFIDIHTLDSSHGYFDILQYFDSKMPSDSISEHLFFKILLGGMPPDPHSISMGVWGQVDCASHNNSYNHLLQKGPVLWAVYTYTTQLFQFSLMAWPHKSRLLRPWKTSESTKLINTHYWSDMHMCAIVDINMFPRNLKALLIFSLTQAAQ